MFLPFLAKILPDLTDFNVKRMNVRLVVDGQQLGDIFTFSSSVTCVSVAIRLAALSCG